MLSRDPRSAQPRGAVGVIALRRPTNSSAAVPGGRLRCPAGIRYGEVDVSAGTHPLAAQRRTDRYDLGGHAAGGLERHATALVPNLAAAGPSASPLEYLAVVGHSRYLCQRLSDRGGLP